MNRNRTIILALISLVLSSSFASAASLNILNGPFQTLMELLRNQNSVFFFTVVFFFMLLYGIYAVGLKFVPAFKGGNGLSRQGKVVAISLSGLSTLSVFYFTKGGIRQVLENVLDPFGVFAGVALAALFAGISYFGIKGNSNEKSFALIGAALGFGLVVSGMILTSDSMMSYGFLLMLIAMIFGLVFNKWGSGGHDKGGHDPHKEHKEPEDKKETETAKGAAKGPKLQEPHTAHAQFKDLKYDDKEIKFEFEIN